MAEPTLSDEQIKEAEQFVSAALIARNAAQVQQNAKDIRQLAEHVTVLTQTLQLVIRLFSEKLDLENEGMKAFAELFGHNNEAGE